MPVARAGAMVRAAVADTNQNGTPETETHVHVEHVHLVPTLIDLDILVDALRWVGNVEFAEQLEAIRLTQTTVQMARCVYDGSLDASRW